MMRTAIPKTECLCVPALNFVCLSCRNGETMFKAEEVATADTPPDLTGYGYQRAEQDGFQRGDVCTPEEHYEESFLAELSESFGCSLSDFRKLEK